MSARAGRSVRARVDLAPLRSSPAFRRLWLSQAVSFLAWRVTFVVAPLQVYELTGSTTAVGLLGLTQLVPLLTVAVLGGAVADVLDRRTVLLASGSVVVVAMAGFAVNAAMPRPSVAACFALNTVAWAAYGLGPGAMRAGMARLVREDQLSAAAALTALYHNLATIGGPAVAGLVVQGAGVTVAYAVALTGALAGTVGAATLPRLPPSGETAALTPRLLGSGLAYVARRPLLRTLFLVDTVAMVVGMPHAVFPALAGEIFGDPTVVGLLYAAPGAGALVASLTAGWIGLIRFPGQAILIAIAAWGAAITAFALAPTLASALAFLALAGAADQINGILRTTITLTVTPDHLRGRVSALEFAQMSGAPALGSVEASLLASLVGLRASIAAGGVACLAAVAITALASTSLRRHRAPVSGARPVLAQTSSEGAE